MFDLGTGTTDTDDDATISIAKIKNKYKSGGAQPGQLAFLKSDVVG
jgi:hypothetical protein